MRSAPLPLVLLSFNYSTYLLAGLIALFSAGGISESEEWRIFIIGWLTIPLAGPALALGLAHLKRVHYADIESFYPLVLITNTLLWVGYFAYHFPPPWIFEYTITPQALHSLVWLLPLVNLLVLFALTRHKFPFVQRYTNRIYFFLPLAALYIGLNFSGFQISKPNLLIIPWPVLNQQEGEIGPVDHDLTKGKQVFNHEGYPLSIDITAKVSGTLQVPLPWYLLKEARLKAWHVAEEEWVEINRTFVEFESEFLHAEISSRVPFMLKQKGYQIGDEAHPLHALGSHENPSNPWLLYAGLALALVALVASRHNPLPTFTLPAFVIDSTILLTVVLLVFDVDYLFDAHHYNFFLGPINDVLRGKTLLVDINCQYGVGNIYFLALLFKLLPLPFNYQSFSLLLSTLLILQYALVYLLLRRLLDSQALAATALLLIVATNYYSQPGATFPSTGPLRFGMAYVLLALFFLRERIDNRPRIQIVLYTLVGCSSLWSFETFTYTLATYLCTELYTLLWNPQTLKQRLHRLLPLLAGPTVAIAVGHLLLALFTYLRAGAWPEWNHYFEYIAFYSVSEFGTITIEAWYPWALYIAVYFLSLLLLLHKTLLSPAPAAISSCAVIAGLTGFGIVQFTYFLGRSHPNNLYHICIPLVIVAMYWFLYMQHDTRHIPRPFVHSATYCFFVAAFVLLANTVPTFITKWPRSPLYTLIQTAQPGPSPWTATATHTEVRDALAFIDRYAADKDRIALFLHPERTTETLMLSQKTHIFPLSNPQQDGLLPTAHERALQYNHGMQEGDYLIMSRNISSLVPIQREVVTRLLSQSRGLRIDSTKHVYAIRLFTP